MKKNEGKAKVGIILIIILLLIIAGLCYVIYDLYNNKLDSEAQINDLNGQVEKLNGKIEVYEEKLDQITKTIKESSSKENEKNDLKLGKYVTEKDLDPSDGAGIYNIILSENNEFTLNWNYGGVVDKGEYVIENQNKLICKASFESAEEGGHSEGQINNIYEFEIVNNNQLKFVKYIKNDKESSELQVSVNDIFSLEK